MDAVGNTVGANAICPSRCLLNFEATTITMETNNGCSLSGAEGTLLEIIEFIGWDSASLTHPCSGFLEIKGDRGFLGSGMFLPSMGAHAMRPYIDDGYEGDL
jgi:hypothetical protein